MWAQADAIRRGDFATAAGLLSPSALAAAHPWPDAHAVPPELAANETWRGARWDGAGGPLALERGREGWRITEGVLGLMRATTPEQALSSFALAVLSRDYRALLGLMPERDRAAWSSERLAAVFGAHGLEAKWTALAQGLRAGGSKLTWVDRAQVRASLEGTTIVLVREDSGWKIFDVLPIEVYSRP